MKRSEWKKHTAVVAFDLKAHDGYRNITIALKAGEYNDTRLVWKGQAHDLNRKAVWPGEDPGKYTYLDVAQLESTTEEWRNTFDVTEDDYEKENNPSRDPVFGHWYALDCEVRFENGMGLQVECLRDIARARNKLREEGLRVDCEGWELIQTLKALGVTVTFEAYTRLGFGEKPASTRRAYSIERWLGSAKALDAKAAEAVRIAKSAAEDEKDRSFHRGHRDARDGKLADPASSSNPDYLRGWRECSEAAVTQNQ